MLKYFENHLFSYYHTVIQNKTLSQVSSVLVKQAASCIQHMQRTVLIKLDNLQSWSVTKLLVCVL